MASSDPKIIPQILRVRANPPSVAAANSLQSSGVKKSHTCAGVPWPPKMNHSFLTRSTREPFLAQYLKQIQGEP